jgi:glycosyltransferase involved in cell wall biosynthesis
VLDDDSSVLVEPTPDAFAEGVLRVLNDQALGARVGARAMRVAAEKYSDEAFIEKTRRAFRILADDGPAATVGDAA